MTSGGFRNITAVINALGRKSREIDKRVEIASKVVGAAATREVKLQIKGSHDRGTKTPSLPGQPPTNISGDLRRSVRFSSHRVGFGSYLVRVGPTMIYGRAVELGNPNWGSGINYPYVAPAARILQQNGTLLTIYKRAVQQGLKA